jgi:hypothetical protein
MTRKWILPLTYQPKIPGVIAEQIRQTIRPGSKYAEGNLISFHGWEGKPYRSKWSFRTRYFELLEVIDIGIYPDGIDNADGTGFGSFAQWVDLDELARRDGIYPPTGKQLGHVFTHAYRISGDGSPFQILRW